MSGAFLYVIAILNLVILVSIVKVFRRMRRGEYDERELEHQLNSRGLMSRFYGRFTRRITESWQMYPVGVLFGLRTIYDRSLLEVETVNFNAGTHTDSITMSRSDLIRIGGGEVAAFSTA